MNRVPVSVSGRPFVINYPEEIGNQGSDETAVSAPPPPSADLRQRMQNSRLRRNKIATASCIAIGASGILLSAGFGIKAIVDGAAVVSRRQQQFGGPAYEQQFDDKNFGKAFACMAGVGIGAIITTGGGICAKVFWKSWSPERAALPLTEREGRSTPTQSGSPGSLSALRVGDAGGPITSDPFGATLLNVEQAPTDVENPPLRPV